jgi:uncharacterized membrane protein YgcG
MAEATKIRRLLPVPPRLDDLIHMLSALRKTLESAGDTITAEEAVGVALVMVARLERWTVDLVYRSLPPSELEKILPKPRRGRR